MHLEGVRLGRQPWIDVGVGTLASVVAHHRVVAPVFAILHLFHGRRIGARLVFEPGRLANILRNQMDIADFGGRLEDLVLVKILGLELLQGFARHDESPHALLLQRACVGTVFPVITVTPSRTILVIHCVFVGHRHHHLRLEHPTQGGVAGDVGEGQDLVVHVDLARRGECLTDGVGLHHRHPEEIHDQVVFGRLVAPGWDGNHSVDVRSEEQGLPSPFVRLAGVGGLRGQGSKHPRTGHDAVGGEIGGAARLMDVFPDKVGEIPVVAAHVIGCWWEWNRGRAGSRQWVLPSSALLMYRPVGIAHAIVKIPIQIPLGGIIRQGSRGMALRFGVIPGLTCFLGLDLYYLQPDLNQRHDPPSR